MRAPSTSVPRRIAHRRARRDASGFTLVELTVALLAGLLVAMGIVALSREATSTFHEEARSSAAEAALRTAVDRLRADLQRAGFMSTGNITSAVRIATVLGNAANFPTTAPAGIQTLTSIARTPGGSASKNGLALSAQQPIPPTPDLMTISGNMTSADEFDVASISTTAQPGCTRIFLAPTSPALFRVIGAAPYPANMGQELYNVFYPSTAAPSAVQFIVRLVDTNQCAQYLQTCRNGPVAGLTTGTNLPFVDIDTNTPVVTANVAGGNCGVSGFGEGSTVNPVQTVQWEITTPTGQDVEPAGYAGLAATGKYDLMRSYVGVDGKIVPDTSEIIAEYAVDLSFAFSVETGTALNPNIQTFAFDDPSNDTWAVPLVPGSPAIPNHGPQRIRSVRARLVTRTAIADRTVNIAVAPPNYATEKFAYRYCVSANGCGTAAAGLQWARTRTITTEVALPNQAGNFY